MAKQIGVSSKDLLDRLNERGINVKNNFSCLTKEQEAVAFALFASPEAAAPPAPKPRKRPRSAPAVVPADDGRVTRIAAKVAELEDLAAQIAALLARRKQRAVERARHPGVKEIDKPAITAPAPPKEPAPAAVAEASAPPVEALPVAPPEAPIVASPAAPAAPDVSVAPPIPAAPDISAAPDVPTAPDTPAAAPPEPAREAALAPEAPEAPAPVMDQGAAKIMGPPRTGKTRRVVTMLDRLGGPKPFITRPATPLTRPAARPGPRPAPGPRRAEGERPSDGRPPSPFGVAPGAPAKGQPRRRGARGKARFFPVEHHEEQWSGAQIPRGIQRHKTAEQRAAARRPEKVDVTLPVTVKEFSLVSGIRQSEILKFFLMRKQIVNANSHLSNDMLEELGINFEVEIEVRKEFDLEAPLRVIEEQALASTEKRKRPPVVTFLGHVDHGKTSLLDYIRKTNIHEREAGGITQHISACRIDLPAHSITFVDTPGHAAFTNMRARGARVTDIAVLVVAADDGVMPQTEEALDHIRAADVGVIVALNKCDLPAANPDRAKHRLAELGLIPPEWGGDTEILQVSAVTGQGVPDLLETINLMAEVKDLAADPALDALGVVLEAKSSGGRGILVTALVQHGTLRVGDYVLCGQAHGRIRGLWSTTTGAAITEAGPSTPVEIMGLPLVPEAGDKFYVLRDPALAGSIAEERQRRWRELKRSETEQVVTLEGFLKKFSEAEEKELRLVLKADVKGSVEAIQQQIIDLGTDEVHVKILSAGVGMVNEGDVTLAEASKGIVIGFNVTIDERARSLSEERGVQIRVYHVIYELLDDVKAGLEDRLTPLYEEVVSGHAEILRIFHASKLGSIAGCMVRDGVIHRADQVRVFRGGEKVHEGAMSSLQRGKDSAKEVREGFECGIKFAAFEDCQEGDVVECFRMVAKRRTL
ncbi:MAG: Translation initiation factor IF-2 [Planctomycetes bacterium ADurb.Bin069]|nr:MAG: Translation initiation factor IF-2 [Planctomycetes bacterium ADurb.Bin069]